MRRLSLAVAAAALAGCATVPQPLATDADQKRANLLVAPPESAGGVAVDPTLGIAAAFAGRLDAAVAEALRGQDVPAWVADAASPRRPTHRLVGSAGLAPHDRWYDRLEARWDLWDANGASRGGARLVAFVPHGLAQGPAPRELAEIAAKVAAQIAPLVDPARAAAPTVASVPSELHIGAIAAPGDGPAALARALRASLLSLGVKLADRPGPIAVTVAGAVELGPRTPSGAQAVRIVWRALAPDGAEIGRAEQANDVPAGSLDRAWGPVAGYVAEEAAPALKALLARAPAPSTPARSSAR